ncbi:histone deacetylase complex subunit SAP18 [Planoprotostelium fungivorum]|uniref:Histone deacetylase complex subunit SAP18 n=1 Tax=Planoprotostelium fungivorum TaxID=1890364 RepID=A0A2P6NQ77_9EUKA|nr:histone deacetylase complex subunit SAP18 [Planoprotostelium fungivorum]
MASLASAAQPVKVGLQAGDIQRDKVCPFLLRLFWRFNGHHRKDATLRELTDLLRASIPDLNGRNYRLHFQFIYPNSIGNWTSKDVGETQIRPKEVNKDDTRTLDSLEYVVGDIVDVAIYPIYNNHRQ